MKYLALTLLFFLISICCFAQITIKGRIVSNTDNKPVSNASVFLSNATIGDHTAADGSFTLTNVKPGQYNLIVSIVGFDTYKQSVTIGETAVALPDITIIPKTTTLNEVIVKVKRSDPEREKYFEKFKEEFVGRTALAADCKILNPELLDFNFKADSDILTASSVDFLEIQNDALGYKVKYMVNDFTLRVNTDGIKTLKYTGSNMFEELKGTPSQQRVWQRQRADAYEGSDMHFFRAAIADRLEEEGFLVMRMKLNSQKPADSIIKARMDFFKNLKTSPQYKDSLTRWTRLSKLPRYTGELVPMNRKDIIRGPDRYGFYSLSGNYGMLYINYNKYHRFDKSYIRLGGTSASGNTLIAFNQGDVLFDSNGVVADPRSLIYEGAWARKGVANLLPVDYEDVKHAGYAAGAPINALISKLRVFADSLKIEKSYLQFDKPFYVSGDTIYFKAYVVQSAQHIPTQLSGVLNIDLINPANKVIQSLKLKLNDGVTWGDFTLADTLKGGSYRVRAYTNWMRNEGESAFFEQVIPVGNMAAKSVAGSSEAKTVKPIEKNVAVKTDLQFFPEGGSLVAGNYSKIAFKSIGPDGLGKELKGTVTDDSGAAVCTFASTHLGMGVFNMVPQANKIYKASITYADGSTNSLDLPKAVTNGYTINLNNSNPDTIRIRITGGSESSLDKLSLVAQSGGTVYYAAENNSSAKFFSAVIPKSKFPTGIVQFTLFSPNGEPLNERLVFIENHDELKLDLSNIKTSYAPRQKVKVELEGRDRDNKLVTGSFSVAVTDETTVPADTLNENTLLSNLLLTSELKGSVEQPNYYFTGSSAKTQADLDVLMLTQGYRRFSWKQVLRDNPEPITYQPEKAIQISGTVKKNGKPAANAKVTLFSKAGGMFMLDTLTDANGKFAFKNLLFADSTKFVVQSKVPKGQDAVTLEVDTVLSPQLIIKNMSDNAIKTTATADMSAYLINQKQFYEEQQKYGINKHAVVLQEVKVEAKYQPKIPHSQNLNGSGNADYVLTAKDIERFICGRLSDCLEGVYWLHFINGVPSGGAVVIDGTFVDPEVFADLRPDDIEGIEVVRGPHYGAIYGSRMAGGGLIITTKTGRKTNNYYRYAPGVVTYMPKGFYKAREFYSPQYDNPKTNQKITGLRSTIYWNPNIITDKDGKASFSYFNADGKGTYRVVIEGIDADGNLGRQVYRYKVE
ncbi:carboxypeptidase regulatory-like domain-containing protein [Mucilaginibacter xinganensis]|uniref:Macroglobulin domain-containing protein n=1 Tax=Mucilaginibacter xinganensis TaxID=1234841 RepID=A0A223P1K4_9SPHI|nr:carboxypeptidase regulatory-like domain-containing protein [Mucilaginibacter xinganensis]ASU36002.1 hypothetical protein MuYL_4117 [Mucilaginibacter xinganensis]